MLASITPLGERGRNSNYWITTTAFVIGATGAGALVGSVLGALGRLTIGQTSSATRLIALSIVVAAALIIELRKLPSITRQVNEEWMHAFRGWVYGIGYGAQLGTGVATVVTTGAVYALLVGEWLCADITRAAIAGAAFGFIRGVSLLAGAAIRTPSALVRLDAVLRRGERPARWIAWAGQGVIALACLAWVAR